jgi:hypothetical protein
MQSNTFDAMFSLETGHGRGKRTEEHPNQLNGGASSRTPPLSFPLLELIAHS